jgi:DNA replication protein DnaC
MAKRKNQPSSATALADEVCAECGGTGYLLLDGGAKPCTCREDRQAGRRLKRANIPPRFATKTLDTFQSRTRPTKDIHQSAEAYISSFNTQTLDSTEITRTNGLLFIGGVGSGKTHVAVAVLRAVIGRGFTGRYTNVVDLLDDLRAAFEPNAPQSGQEIIDDLVRVDLLVLDDLGAESPTGWVHDRLYQIINRRYEENRPTIVTTNLALDELEKQVGPRITSRLCEMCSEITFPNRDWRRANMR